MWPHRYDAARVYCFMAGVIVVLDMLHVHGLRDAPYLIEISDVSRQVRIIGNPADIAFEMPDINWIEAHQSGEETEISLGN